MKKFTTGFLAGATVTIASIAAIAFGFKKTVIEPIEEKEQMIEDNRRKAMRKSRAR
ncbi:DUF3042 family protein [Vagococcus acidifermentans]|uniref:DUF3042 domain-containing protein n=1 Tax=Vagococcus acidifermentans TaxID=564710 RepID=A0A430AMH7_9ENTE|nr:DUF3042 family protein [Vagococcus acidifermentans]RSU09332.1 DUF3042 domain-containing protein [Vagococcus acidifermentans]